MNRCDAIRPRLVELAYHELTEPERAQVDEHLADCVGCREHLAQLVSTCEVLGSPEIATPVRLPVRWLHSWARQHEMRRQATIRRVTLTMAATAAVVMIAVSWGVRLEANRQQIRIYWQTVNPVAELPTVEKTEPGTGAATYRRLLQEWDTPRSTSPPVGNTIATVPTNPVNYSYLRMRHELGEL